MKERESEDIEVCVSLRNTERSGSKGAEICG